MSKKEVVLSENAPKALGPYSVAVKSAGFVFTAGQVGINPQTGEIVEGGIEAETRQVLTNLKSVLEDSGSSLDDVVKTIVFLREINDFEKMNAVYAQFFTQEFPARSAVQVAALPRNAAVEIEAVAVVR